MNTTEKTYTLECTETELRSLKFVLRYYTDAQPSGYDFFLGPHNGVVKTKETWLKKIEEMCKPNVAVV